MTETEKSTKTGADVAHFYRALGRAGAVGMPMPFQVYGNGLGMELRYRTTEDVDQALAYIGGTAVHDDYVHESPHEWHGYGNKYGNAVMSFWSGYQVLVWAAIDGPPPEREPQVEHETRIRQLPGGPVEVRCSCGQWGGVAPSIKVAEQDAAKHRAEKGGKP